MILHPNEIQTSCDSELSHSIMAKSVVFVRLASQSHSRALVTKRHTRAHDRKGRARERTGLSRDHFGGACQIHRSVLSRKSHSSSKKSPQIEYTKSCYFLILSKMEYTNFFDKNITFGLRHCWLARARELLCQSLRQSPQKTRSHKKSNPSSTSLSPSPSSLMETRDKSQILAT